MTNVNAKIFLQMKRAQILVRWARAAMGSPGLGPSNAHYFIEGNIGVGKTTLLQEIQRVAEAGPGIIVYTHPEDIVIHNLAKDIHTCLSLIHI